MNDEMMRAFNGLELLAYAIGNNAKAKGFREQWETAVDEGDESIMALNVSQKLMLISDELTEAHETLRKDGLIVDSSLINFRKVVSPSPKGNFGEELADVIIRTLELADMINIDIGREVASKMETNSKRPHMHGGKKF